MNKIPRNASRRLHFILSRFQDCSYIIHAIVRIFQYRKESTRVNDFYHSSPIFLPSVLPNLTIRSSAFYFLQRVRVLRSVFKQSLSFLRGSGRVSDSRKERMFTHIVIKYTRNTKYRYSQDCISALCHPVGEKDDVRKMLCRNDSQRGESFPIMQTLYERSALRFRNVLIRRVDFVRLSASCIIS